MHSIRQRTTVGKCKIKAAQTDLGIFTHIPSYSSIFPHICLNIPGYIQAYSDIIRHIQELLRHIQNSGIFRALAYSEPEAYSEP